MTPARHTKSFPLFPNHYFNISDLLPCCKKMKKKFGPFVGPPFCEGPSLAEHAEHA